MPQAPDLFVVCRNCGSEVSSYVTECPYCGTRLRKRAPKLEGTPLKEGRRGKRPRTATPRLPKLRPGEIPGVRPDPSHPPYVTIALCVLMALGTIALVAFPLSDVAIVGSPTGEWWKVATAPFFAENLWYAVAVILAVAIFGSRLEDRHGGLVVLLLFCVCGMGGIAAAAALETVPLAAGANGAALGLAAAYAVRPVLELRRGEEPEADLLGVAVITLVLLLMPLAASEASPTAGAAGLLAGLACGIPLARR